MTLALRAGGTASAYVPGDHNRDRAMNGADFIAMLGAIGATIDEPE